MWCYAPSFNSSMLNSDQVEEIITQLEQLRVTRIQTEERERQLLRDLRALTRNGDDTRAPAPARGAAQHFPRGSLVYITNRLGATHIFRHRASDRAGTVTRTSDDGDRVYLTTFNGFETWRAPANLVRLTQTEADRIRHQNRA